MSRNNSFHLISRCCGVDFNMGTVLNASYSGSPVIAVIWKSCKRSRDNFATAILACSQKCLKRQNAIVAHAGELSYVLLYPMYLLDMVLRHLVRNIYSLVFTLQIAKSRRKKK